MDGGSAGLQGSNVGMENFKVGGEYHRTILNSCKKAF